MRAGDGDSEAARPAAVVVLTFRIDGEPYALPAESVREVTRAVTIRRLPRAPAAVEGVIDVRGKLVPVLDLRQRFALPPKALDPSEYLLIAAAADGRPVAMRADELPEVATLAPEQMEPVRGLAATSPYVAGVGKTPDGLVFIHDPATFLTQTEQLALDEAMAARAAAGA